VDEGEVHDLPGKGTGQRASEAKRMPADVAGITGLILETCPSISQSAKGSAGLGDFFREHNADLSR